MGKDSLKTISGTRKLKKNKHISETNSTEEMFNLINSDNVNTKNQPMNQYMNQPMNQPMNQYMTQPNMYNVDNSLVNMMVPMSNQTGNQMDMYQMGMQQMGNQMGNQMDMQQMGMQQMGNQMGNQMDMQQMSNQMDMQQMSNQMGMPQMSNQMGMQQSAMSDIFTGNQQSAMSDVFTGNQQSAVMSEQFNKQSTLGGLHNLAKLSMI